VEASVARDLSHTTDRFCRSLRLKSPKNCWIAWEKSSEAMGVRVGALLGRTDSETGLYFRGD
jgi:hypothetical protein